MTVLLLMFAVVNGIIRRDGDLNMFDCDNKQCPYHPENNVALAWDELKGMEGRPVWIEYNIKRKDRTLLAWCLVLIVLDEYMSVQTNAVAFRVNKSEIGTKWQAYRKERS